MLIEYSQKAKGADGYVFYQVCTGHVQVFDGNGKFLFSADNEREAREELRDYEEFAA